jgi:transposase-like protein
VIIVVDVDQAERDLAAGRLACPHCRGVLRAWSLAARRRVRRFNAPDLVVQPRRARCRSCGATQVLLPASCLPRRADATEVVGAALLAKAQGQGYRRIARDLHRPASTVRRWLRRATGEHVEWLRRRGVDRAHLLDAEVLAHLEPQRTDLADALAALGAAVAAWRRRFARHAAAWTLIGVFTGGRLLGPTPAG